MPYNWPLPLPNEAERLQALSLTSVWSGDEADAILAPLRDDEDTTWPPEDLSVISATQAVRDLIPDTHRAIKTVRNTLAVIEKTLLGRVGQDLRDAITAKYPGTGLHRGLVPSFVLLLTMVDSRWPELELLTSFEKSSADVSFRLQSLYEAAPMFLAPTKEHEAALRSLGHGGDVLADNEAPQAMFRLGRILCSWRRASTEAVAEDFVLFISFYGDANAPNTFRPRLTEVPSERQTHLDLRLFAPHGRPTSGEQVLKAVRHSEKQLEGLADTAGRLLLGAEAPLSFLAWLGFWLDHRRVVVAFNAKTLISINVPRKLDFPDLGRDYTPCAVQWVAEGTGSKHARVIFDFSGRSVPNNLEAFPPVTNSRGEPDEPLRGRLLYSGGSDFNFGDVEAILRAVLELVNELRERGVTTLHAGLAMPDVVAFALGRQLKSRGLTIVLYEFIGARYERAIALEE